MDTWYKKILGLGDLAKVTRLVRADLHLTVKSMSFCDCTGLAGYTDVLIQGGAVHLKAWRQKCAQKQPWSLLSAYCNGLQRKWTQLTRFPDDIIQCSLSQLSKTGHAVCKDKQVKPVQSPNKEAVDLMLLLFPVEVLLQQCYDVNTVMH